MPAEQRHTEVWHGRVLHTSRVSMSQAGKQPLLSGTLHGCWLFAASLLTNYCWEALLLSLMLPLFFFSNIFRGSVSKTYNRAQELKQLIPKPFARRMHESTLFRLWWTSPTISDQFYFGESLLTLTDHCWMSHGYSYFSLLFCPFPIWFLPNILAHCSLNYSIYLGYFFIFF